MAVYYFLITLTFNDSQGIQQTYLKACERSTYESTK